MGYSKPEAMYAELRKSHSSPAEDMTVIDSHSPRQTKSRTPRPAATAFSVVRRCRPPPPLPADAPRRSCQPLVRRPSSTAAVAAVAAVDRVRLPPPPGRSGVVDKRRQDLPELQGRESGQKPPCAPHSQFGAGKTGHGSRQRHERRPARRTHGGTIGRDGRRHGIGSRAGLQQGQHQDRGGAGEDQECQDRADIVSVWC